MEGKNLKDVFKKRATKAGAVLLATVIVFGGSVWTANQSGSVPELTKFVDTVETGADTVEIEAEGTPLADTKVTTKTKTTKKTKKVKLKSKATKTYSKKSGTKKTTKTAKKTTNTATTTTKTVTATSMTSSFKKGSNINTQVTTTKTTVTTTVVSKAASSAVVSKSAASNKVANGEVDLSKAAPKLKSNIASAYKTLNFKITVDSSVTYSGLFDARSQSITLRSLDDTVYHELGHFVAFAAGNVDTSSDFQKIFAQEKSKYTAFNKTYVLQNSSEYFAESFKEYTLNPAALKSARPDRKSVV